MTWGELGPFLTATVLAIGTILFLRRFGGGTALAELERANGILERRVKQLEREREALAAEVTILKARTDIAEALVPVATALEDHDHHSKERDDRVIELLTRIADTVSPAADEPAV